MMLTFKQYLIERNMVGVGSVLVFANRSKQYGDKSVRDFNSGKRVITPVQSKMGVDKRFDRIEKVLGHVLNGLINQRHQIGNHVAVSTSGHVFSSSLLKRKRP